MPRSIQRCVSCMDLSGDDAHAEVFRVELERAILIPRTRTLTN